MVITGFIGKRSKGEGVCEREGGSEHPVVSDQQGKKAKRIDTTQVFSS